MTLPKSTSSEQGGRETPGGGATRAKESIKGTTGGYSSLVFKPWQHDWEEAITPTTLNEVGQKARSELKAYEESFDSERIWKRRMSLENQRVIENTKPLG
ncbi:hypothetical protein BJY01DRAFT_212145 [Aspergillus pseudoustus]|uniref:Uncharacterized protein n=1 Tax=Aspergillus pseudoustus TaxID=1810923 RepID=A0ABR4K8U6_9EURO